MPLDLDPGGWSRGDPGVRPSAGAASMAGVKRTLRAALGVPLLLLAAACGEDAPPVPQTSPGVATTAPAPSAPPSGDPAAQAAAALAAMGDAELAGQVLMPYAYGSGAASVDA